MMNERCRGSNDHKSVNNKGRIDESSFSSSCPSSSSVSFPSRERQTNRIAFGSCNHQSRVNKLWPIVEARDPAAFIWGGDAIYGDKAIPAKWNEFPPKTTLDCADPDRLRRFYAQQRNVPGYKRLLDKNVPVFGTFDDHDYGCNNADRTFPYRKESAQAYMEFLNGGRSDLNRAMTDRANEGLGLYGVKLFDFARPDGDYVVPDEVAGLDPDVIPYSRTYSNSSSSFSPPYSNHSVAIFVLDCRSHKTPWKKGMAAYQNDNDGDYLGHRQWEWLEEALRRSHASVNVIVNGLQVHADIYPDGNVAESWSRYPRAQQRLFDAVLQPNVKAPLLVSGDVHMAQFMRKECKDSHIRNNANTRPLIEMTTSGMTHSWGTITNRDMVQPKPVTVKEWFESTLAASMMRLLHYLCPWTDLMVSPSRRALQSSSSSSSVHDSTSAFANGGLSGSKTGTQFSLQKNFGELEFDWDHGTVAMRVIGERGEDRPLLAAQWTLDQLSGYTHMPGASVGHNDYNMTLRDRGDAAGRWTCVSYRGRASTTDRLIGHATTALALVVLVPLPFVLSVYFLLWCTRKWLRCRKIHPCPEGAGTPMK